MGTKWPSMRSLVWRDAHRCITRVPERRRIDRLNEPSPCRWKTDKESLTPTVFQKPVFLSVIRDLFPDAVRPPDVPFIYRRVNFLPFLTITTADRRPASDAIPCPIGPADFLHFVAVTWSKERSIDNKQLIDRKIYGLSKISRWKIKWLKKKKKETCDVKATLWLLWESLELCAK